MDLSLYQDMLDRLFVRFPSVQNTGFGDAYKPGLEHMEDFDALLGHPDRKFRTIHVAGTNGKGSVANMLASALAASGLKVGLYTSPHILDFRERMRIIDGGNGSDKAELITCEEVWDFVSRWNLTFDELKLSFFEITTGMAFDWFAKRNVDVAVIEVGLGGRLDSTNIITPELAVITSIGLDHCALLGNTRAEIAAEKAGIFKAGIPAVIGSEDEETAEVFRLKAKECVCTLTFASEAKPSSWAIHDEILAEMDLKGDYQQENLRTTLVALDILGVKQTTEILEAICRTTARMDFHGRWEMLGRTPDIICDIGHNPPALAKNFAQLEDFLARARYTRIIIVYGVMADKDLSGIIPLMPLDATYVTVAPATARAMDADTLYHRCLDGLGARGLGQKRIVNGGTVREGLRLALGMASDNPEKTLIYIGGSTFVVSEATAALQTIQHT